MIPRLPHWHRVEDDDVLSLTHPDGPTAGVIRYRERVRPVRAFDQLLAASLAAAPLTAIELGPIEAFATLEGERAACATTTATRDGQPVTQVLAAVFGDDFYARITGRATDPAQFAALARTVRDLALRDVHALGVRRRGVVVPGPAGWAARARGLATDWTAPEGDAVIRLFPAEPSAGPVDALATLVAATEASGGCVLDIDGPHDLTAPGLSGATWRIASRDRGGREARCDLAVLNDPRYEYAAVLESRGAAVQDRHRTAFHALVTSIPPFAAPGALATRAAADVLAHWTL